MFSRSLYIPALVAMLAPLLSAQGAPSGLRTEYLVNPLGVDVTQPRFSWLPQHAERAQKQTAYQVLVSRNPDAGDVWDSGRMESAETAQVAYAGKPLASGESYFWKVRYWDAAGRPSPYSAVARFDTGLFSAADWKGKWIGGANQFRREFTLPGRPVRARVYICGLGYYELRINGKKVGDHVLDPGWTTYDKRVLYSTYDVTSLLRAGPNAAGVMLGQGWYGSRVLLMQMNIEMEGGQRVEVVSDAEWKSRQGPLVSDSIYNGETYDARMEAPGWDRPGFSGAGWSAASVAEAPKGVLSAQMMPPIRVTETITPLKMTSPRAGMYVYDMGQNFSGWVRLHVKGPRGARVQLRHAELLYEDGTLNVENLRKARATDVYILRGGGEEETYEPRFTYHGFRYVELTGYPGTPGLDTISGKVVHSAVAPSGRFASSKQILNQIQRLVYWGIRSNLHSVPTDCNQRDERMGWMADAHLYAESAMLNFDTPAFYANFLRNIHDIQAPDGTVTDTVPHKFGRRPADPTWGSAYPLILWYMYEYYGDRRLLKEHYDGIKAWAGYLRSRSEDGVVKYFSYGDWVPVLNTPGGLVSTFYYYWSVDIVRRAAEILGRSADAEEHRKLGESIRTAFHRRFFNDELDSYGNGSQTSNLLALYLNLAPKEGEGKAMRSLVNDIVYTRDTHLTTGIVGAKYILPFLTRSGRSDLAYELATQTSYPSWGYMVENGATTLWELWQNKTGPSMNSHNHPMFGSISGWFYNALAGINPELSGPGFAKVRIEPQVVRDLKWASGTVDTIRGPVSSSWRRTDDGLRLEVAIPVGVEATIRVPTLGLDSPSVEESGKAVWSDGRFQPGVSGIAAGRVVDGDIILQAGSGSYVFELCARSAAP